MTKALIVALTLAFAVACTEPPTPPPPAPPPNPSAIARISITPGAAMLTKAGETRVLSAKAFNVTGTEVAASFTWTSSKPSAVSVDSSGKLTAVTAVGSSQITVSSGALQSPPALVTVVTPATGAVLVGDEQVVSPPTPVNPDAEPDLTNEYEVVLKNLEPPAAGTILLGTGAAPIGGKVVSSETVAGGVRVRLKLATVKEMVAKASFDEVMSFRGAPLSLPKAISDAYSVTQSGDEYTLTPKSAASARGDIARVRPQGNPQGTSVFTALPFNECTTNTPALPITLSALPTLSIKIDPTYELKTDEFGALERLVFKATPSLKATIPFVINADATISLECTSTLYSKLIPLPGWLGVILAGELEAGIGFELTGKVTLFNAGVELSSETVAQVELGMECAFGECNMVKKLTTVKNENKVSWKVPNLGQLRVEPSLFGFGYVKAKLGATLLKSLRIEALGAKAGVKYEASLAPAFVQVQPTPAPDPDYQSSYKVAALLEISAGKKINNLLTNLGIVKFNALKFSSSFPLGQSPKATGMTVDRDSFAPNDTLNFKVALYPDTASFPLLGYNVAKIVIYRNRLGTVEEVASASAAPNQTDFQIPWVANIGSAAGGNQFFAFVQTKLPSIVDLELGRVAVKADLVGTDGTPFTGTVSVTATQNYNFVGSQNSFDLKDSWSVAGDVQTLQSNRNIGFRNVSQAELTSTNDAKVYNTNGSVNLCGYSVEGQVSTTTTLTALNPAKIQLSFRTTDTEYSLNISETSFNGAFNFTRSQSETRAYRSGQCKDDDLKPSSSSNSGSYSSVFGFNLPELRGAITTDASDKKTIVGNASGTINIPVDFPVGAQKTIQYSINLNLKELVASSSADVELDLIAPASAAPSGKLTYAVNLHNKSSNAATNLRAEFFLPEGFTVTDIQGWSGCATLGSVVTCTLSSLAAGERRAFLIDVQAPASVGESIVSARVTATEGDSTPSDNLDTGATLIAEP